LITPDGKTIELSRETYRKIRHMLVGENQSPDHQARLTKLRKLYGKYANGSSLTKALLEEHAAERARDDARIKRFIGK
jgi:hypothetical protein